MSLRGIRGTLRDFLANGGHISAGISKALGASRDTISNYISRHVIGATVGTVDYIDSISDSGIAAAEYNNTLPISDTIDIGRIPVVPEQYGDDPAGRRITTAVIIGETEDDPGKIVRLDFEDSYTRQDMENLLETILLGWQGDSPEAFTGGVPDIIRNEAIREIYTSRRF